MARFTKYISALVFITILAAALLPLALGTDAVLRLTGYDIEHCVYVNKEGVFEFSLLQRAPYLYAATFILLVALTYIWYRPQVFLHYIKAAIICLRENITACYYAVRYTRLKYLLAIPAVAYLYFAVNLPITHDEATTYVRYIDNTAFGAMACYISPNNHILFSLIGQLFVRLPFIDLLLAVRLPSILISLFTSVVIFRFVRKSYSENMALAVSAISSMTVMILMYSFFSRGYSLATLFVVICLYAAYNILADGNRVRHWMMFAVGGALGFATMPSFLYPFATINLLILFYNYKYISKQIIFNLITVGIVFLFYMPVLVVMGSEAIVGNDFVVSIPRMVMLSRLPGFLIGIVTDLYGLPYYVFLPLFVATIIYALAKRNVKALILWAIFLIAPVLMMVAQSVIPFFRTFSYYGFVFVFLLAVTFKDELTKIGNKYLIIILLAVQLTAFGLFYRESQFQIMMYAGFEKLLDNVLEDKKTYGIKCDFLYPNMQFEIKRHHLDCKVVSYNVEPISIDSLPVYDYILIDRHIDETRLKQPVDTLPGFLNRPVNIYKK